MSDAQTERIIRAKTAVEAYAAVSGGGSFDEVISDLLADLMHYADHLWGDLDQPDFDSLLATAEMNYTAEKEGE